MRLSILLTNNCMIETIMIV